MDQPPAPVATQPEIPSVHAPDGLSFWITSEVEVTMGMEDGEVATEMKNKGQLLRILARRSRGKVATMVKRWQGIWGSKLTKRRGQNCGGP
jgi:hypothetical protein